MVSEASHVLFLGSLCFLLAGIALLPLGSANIEQEEDAGTAVLVRKRVMPGHIATDGSTDISDVNGMPIHVRRKILSGNIAPDGSVEISDYLNKATPKSSASLVRKSKKLTSDDDDIEIPDGLVDLSHLFPPSLTRKTNTNEIVPLEAPTESPTEAPKESRGLAAKKRRRRRRRNRADGIARSRRQKRAPTEAQYSFVQSGTCENAGLVAVTEKRACDAAAKTLGMVKSESELSANTPRPYGCVTLRDRSWLGLYTNLSNIGKGAGFWPTVSLDHNVDLICGKAPTESTTEAPNQFPPEAGCDCMQVCNAMLSTDEIVGAVTDCSNDCNADSSQSTSRFNAAWCLEPS